jgi:branched-chain amino acid transport system ATP-binding protein
MQKSFPFNGNKSDSSKDAGRPSEALLRLSHVTVVYGGGSCALSDVSLSIAPGEIVALLGPNGAGKTTALRAISGLLQFHGGRLEAGAVTLRDRPLYGLDAAARVRLGVAQVMEGRRVFADMSVGDNLRTGAYTRSGRGASRVSIEASLDRVLAYFPVLKERLTGAAGFLSGGEQQMLAIGRALMAEPSLLLLDEPSLGVAPKVVAQIGEIVSRIKADGMSILLVEQNASVALDLCDRALVLESGRVAISGNAAELRDDPRVREIYLGMAGAHRRSFRTVQPVAGGVVT